MDKLAQQGSHSERGIRGRHLAREEKIAFCSSVLGRVRSMAGIPCLVAPKNGSDGERSFQPCCMGISWTKELPPLLNSSCSEGFSLIQRLVIRRTTIHGKTPKASGKPPGGKVEDPWVPKRLAAL